MVAQLCIPSLPPLAPSSPSLSGAVTQNGEGREQRQEALLVCLLHHLPLFAGRVVCSKM